MCAKLRFLGEPSGSWETRSGAGVSSVLDGQPRANRFILGKFGVSIPINGKSGRMAGWVGHRGHLYHGREPINCLTGNGNSCTDLSTTVDGDKVRWK